jgi:hypothetical protein
MVIDTRKSTKIIVFLLIVLVHVAIIFDWHLSHKIPPPPLGSDPALVEITLLPLKPKLADVANDVLEISKNEIPSPKYKTDARICTNKDKHYFGVGFIWNPGSNRVTHAPEDYPAYKAGMRVGDFVVNPDNDFNDGYIDLYIVRERGQQLHFHIKGDNICYQDA